MGMFTIVIDAEGREHQIKTGNDFCVTYRIGEEVPFRVNETPGDVDFPDGYYCSYYSPRTGDQDHVNGTVIIKDHKIADAFNGWSGGHEVEDIDPAWWTSEAWEAKRQQDEQRRAAYEAAFDEHLAKQGLTREEYDNLPPIESMGIVSGFSLLRVMKTKSSARQVFQVDEE